MMLPRNIDEWPEDWRAEYHERLNIMEFDGRLDPTVAAVKAEREIRSLNGEMDFEKA